LWILSVADQRSAAEARIIGRPSEVLHFQGPYSVLEFSLVTRERLSYS